MIDYRMYVFVTVYDYEMYVYCRLYHISVCLIVPHTVRA